ncbi:MAG: WG repeat-containing protein [Ignavibacteriae bacterium]|nr:WG repeat-containing protein [Ignavibacteriota bacterium]
MEKIERPQKLAEPPSDSGHIDYLSPFVNGYARAKVRDLWGYVDMNMHFVVTPRFDGASDFQNGKALILGAGKMKFVSPDGTVLGDLDETRNDDTTGLSYRLSDTLYVSSRLGVMLREYPRLNADTTAVLPYGTPVEVIEEPTTHRLDLVDNVRGYWVLVTARQEDGYVFDGFMSKLPPPDSILEDQFMGSLRNYSLRQIGALGPMYRVEVEPRDYGSYHVYDVQQLHGGMLLTVEMFYEGYETTLEVPNLSVREGLTLIHALLSQNAKDNRISYRTIREDEIGFNYEFGGYCSIKKLSNGILRIKMGGSL